jgi:hypothetical protein
LLDVELQSSNDTIWSPRAPSISIATPQEYTYIGIPLELVLKFVDTLYSYLYSSPLLFHKELFKKNVLEKRAKPYLVLSICALASRCIVIPDAAAIND